MPTVESTIRSGQIVAWRVRLRRRQGAGAGAPADDGLLEPISLAAAMAPEVPRLTCRLRMDRVGEPWRWRSLIDLDDVVELVSDHAEPADRFAAFSGHVVDAEWQFSAETSEVRVTAVGASFHLLRNQSYQVYGRYMWDASVEGIIHASGLPCEFNAAGRPNMHPTACAVGGRMGRVFSWDGDPDADWWTMPEVLHYLLWRYNADESHLTNPQLSERCLAETAPVVANCEQMGLWEAIAEAGAAAGYDVWEAVSADEAGEPAASIAVQHRRAGTLRTLKHQKAGRGGAWEALDRDKTTLFSARVAESNASCIAAPIVLGGRHLYEITVPLQRCWDEMLLAVPAAGVVRGRLTEWATHEYVRKYTTGGSSFEPDYRDVGRLWVANEDGAYNALGLTQPDMPALASITQGAQYFPSGSPWPALPFRPLPLLTMATGGRRRSRALLEWSRAGWRTFPAAWQILTDRLGVWISQRNLADVVGGADEAQHNLFQLLVDGAVSFRLTVTIASPMRASHHCTRRATAGCAATTGRIFDRGSLGAHRERGNSGTYYKSDLPADVTQSETGAAVDQDVGLRRLAYAVRDAEESRHCEATLEVPWPEPAISLGDRIEKIEGIEVPLAVNAGAAARYPRVVGWRWNLTAETYDTQLVLDTWRQAGVV